MKLPGNMQQMMQKAQQMQEKLQQDIAAGAPRTEPIKSFEQSLRENRSAGVATAVALAPARGSGDRKSSRCPRQCPAT